MDAGVSCQLKFLCDESDRDKVVVMDDKGEELARSDDMQHNRNFRDLRKTGAELSLAVLEAIGKTAKAGGA